MSSLSSVSKWPEWAIVLISKPYKARKHRYRLISSSIAVIEDLQRGVGVAGAFILLKSFTFSVLKITFKSLSREGLKLRWV